MGITAIRHDPNPEGRIFKEILLHMNTKSAIAVHRNRNTNKQLDPLSAVKLDPTVLEAQITIDTSAKNEHSPAAFTKKDAESQRRLDFDKAMCMQLAALMSLPGQQLNLLMQYVDTLILQRYSTQKQLECAFCKNNGHALRDGNGRVRCPMLRKISCRLCGATGDHAHTIKYCRNK